MANLHTKARTSDSSGFRISKMEAKGEGASAYLAKICQKLHENDRKLDRVHVSKFYDVDLPLSENQFCVVPG